MLDFPWSRNGRMKCCCCSSAVSAETVAVEAVRTLGVTAGVASPAISERICYLFFSWWLRLSAFSPPPIIRRVILWILQGNLLLYGLLSHFFKAKVF